MANEALVQRVKAIVALARSGDADGAYRGYKELFSSAEFGGFAPEDQRQALKLMILAKGAPQIPSPTVVDAHRAAIAPLVALVGAHREPADHELLGMAHQVVGDDESAATIFRAGLALERERNPQSDLCGSLMKRVSLI